MCTHVQVSLCVWSNLYVEHACLTRVEVEKRSLRNYRSAIKIAWLEPLNYWLQYKIDMSAEIMYDFESIRCFDLYNICKHITLSDCLLYTSPSPRD